MTPKKKDFASIICLSVLLLLILSTGIASLFSHPTKPLSGPKSQLKASIELGHFCDTNRALLVGYNYYLLESYADSSSVEISISASLRDSSLLDSLRRGAIDILVIPFTDSLPKLDSLQYCANIDSLCTWLIRSEDEALLESINSWIDSWHQSEVHDTVQDRFFKRYDAFRSRRRSSISPYDEIIKSHADSLGWDWRLLAAVIYQESRFHIEAQSRRGACGLMQMMPSTAKHYGVEDALNPHENICAGAKLLSALLRRYRSLTSDENELYKYALAAYNAGVGRVDDVVRLAQSKGINTAVWDSTVVVIPQMSGETELDSTLVKVGPFKGRETLAYVESVFSIYEQFKRICP